MIRDVLPLRMTTGSLGKVTAKVPFPNLWSDPLSLSLQTLHLDLNLSPTTTSPSTLPQDPLSPSLDLAHSVTSAADDFLHTELDAYEESALASSIQQSIIFTQSNPFIKDDELPGAFPFPAAGIGGGGETTTVLAGLVERVLARLECVVRDVRVRIRIEGEGVVEVRVGEIGYGEVEGERVVRVKGFEIGMMGQGKEGMSRSSSVSTASGGDEEMAMSMAVADLRESVVGMEESVVSGASVYESAISEDFKAGERSRSVTPTAKVEVQAEEKAVTILSFGTEDIVLRMRTTRAVNENIPEMSSSSADSSSDAQVPSVKFYLSIGTITAMLLPQQLSTLLVASQILAPSSPIPKRDTKPDRPAPGQPPMEASLDLEAIYIALVYDMQAGNDPAFVVSLPRFWAKPEAAQIHVGHLKMRVEGVHAGYTTQGPPAKSMRTSSIRPPVNRTSSTSTARQASFANVVHQSPVITCLIRDISIFEYLTSISTSSEGDDAPPGGSFPVLLFDQGMTKQYEAFPGTSKGTVFPEYDTVDWRNSGLQRKSTGSLGEKAWKVRHKGRGVLKGGVGGQVEEERPVFEVYKPMFGNTGQWVDVGT